MERGEKRSGRCRAWAGGSGKGISVIAKGMKRNTEPETGCLSQGIVDTLVAGTEAQRESDLWDQAYVALYQSRIKSGLYSQAENAQAME